MRGGVNPGAGSDILVTLGDVHSVRRIAEVALVSQVDYDSASEEVRREIDDQIRKHGRVTNMKRTLLQSVPAFKAYMEWYTLAAEIEAFIGKRGLYIFSHAISTENQCLICSTFFRKILKDAGEDPSALVLSDREQLLSDYGRQLVSDPKNIPNELYERLQAAFNEKELLLLTAFAGLMIATNLINTALKVGLDDYLQGY